MVEKRREFQIEGGNEGIHREHVVLARLYAKSPFPGIFHIHYATLYKKSFSNSLMLHFVLNVSAALGNTEWSYSAVYASCRNYTYISITNIAGSYSGS